MRLRDKLTLFLLNHGKLFSVATLAAFAALNLFFFAHTASAITYEQFNASGSSALPQVGVSGLLDTATTWICYRLAPATTTIALVKAAYDIKHHKPDGAKKAVEVGTGAIGIMAAPTIVHGGYSVWQYFHPGP